jgi:ABC-type uncharacterized transport system substrate-binding protein
VLYALFLMLICHPLYAAEPKEVKRVLIFHSEDTENQGQRLTEEGIRSALLSNRIFDIKVYTEYLNKSRFGSSTDASAMADFLRRKYAGIQIDVIITVYPSAVDFLFAERESLFPQVPVIAAVITRRFADSIEHSPMRSLVTGTVVGEKIADLMDETLALKPRTKRVALVAGTSDSDIYAEMGYRKGLERYGDKISVIDLTKLPMKETLNRVSALPEDALVFYSSIFKDGDGKTFIPTEALSQVARVSSVPVFGVLETYMGHGIVGGHLLSFTKHGQEAAEMAMKILEGRSPASIPFGGESAYIYAYDWRELKRWAIPETAVPDGSEIRFRLPSFWEVHRLTIIRSLRLL